MSGRGTPRRRVYLVRRVMAVVVLLLVFGLLVPQAYQALVNAPTGSETRSAEDTPPDNSGEQADRTDRETSREASPDREQASGGAPARTEQNEPAAEPSPQLDASGDNGQDDNRESDQARESEEPPPEEDATAESPAPADESAEAENTENVETAPLLSADPAVVEPVEAEGAGSWDEFSATSLPVVSTYDKVAVRAARKERLRAERRAEWRAAARNARATAPVAQPSFETPAADNSAPAASRAAYRGYAAYQYSATPARNTRDEAAQGGAAQVPARTAKEPAKETASAREAETTEQQTATTSCWAYASSYSYAWSSQYGVESNYDNQYDHDSSQYGTKGDSATCGAEAYSGASSGGAGASAGAGAGSQQGSSYRWQYSN